jgi:segregation and condensation protein B
MHEEATALPSVQEGGMNNTENAGSQGFFFAEALKDLEKEQAVEVSSPEAVSSEDAGEDPVFPPNIYSSARVPGARKVQEKGSLTLDLRIEGLLFVTDAPLTGPQIARILEVPIRDVMDTLRTMIKSFARRRSALELRERIRRGRPAFVIALKPEYRPDVKPLARPALPRRLIDTLALIALNQPLFQSRLVRERGSRIYDHVRALVDHGLVARTKKGLSYELRTTPRFSSEFGLSNNPNDMKAMLARAMTDEEKETLAEYKRINTPPKVVEEVEEFNEATEEAARSLIENREFNNGEAVIVLQPGEQVDANAELTPSAEALSAEPREDLGPTGGSGLNSLSYEQALGKTASGRVKSVPCPVDDEEQKPQLTRWEEMFLKFRQAND